MTPVELSSRDRDCTASEAQDIYYPALQEKVCQKICYGFKLVVFETEPEAACPLSGVKPTRKGQR